MLLLPHFLGSLAVVNAYVWPSPMLDALEAARWNQDGHNSALLATFIEPCNSDLVKGTNSGRADIADWVRTAYHDMATHNVADGTGGLDASIRFLEETSRPEVCCPLFLLTLLGVLTKDIVDRILAPVSITPCRRLGSSTTDMSAVCVVATLVSRTEADHRSCRQSRGWNHHRD
jgi:hypothetical protein